MSDTVRIRVTRDYVLLELEEKKTVTDSGIHLAPKGKLTFKESALVVGIGPTVQSIVVGDEVYFDKQGVFQYEMGVHKYIIVPERNIHGVVVDGT